MSRIAPVEAKSTSWWMRLMFWKAKRMMGRVPAPLPVMAHNPGVAVANAALELAMGRCQALPKRVKTLAELRAATLIGCPF